MCGSNYDLKCVSWGHSLKKDAHCKHTERIVNTLTLTIANPTVTVQPSSLHRQLGPARFLSEAMERAEEEVGGPGL